MAVMAEAEQLDVNAVLPLAMALTDVIRKHLGQMPADRKKVFEVLNATAFAIAPVIGGCEPEVERVVKWFNNAVDEAIVSVLAKYGDD
jgi:hypothetical protein